jgi:hypothetical protein
MLVHASSRWLWPLIMPPRISPPRPTLNCWHCLQRKFLNYTALLVAKSTIRKEYSVLGSQ